MNARTLPAAALAAFVLAFPTHAAAQGPATTPQAAPLTLDAAMARALANNPTVAAARLQRPIDEAGVAVAGERPNPAVEYDTERETPRQALTMTVPLELGGKRARRIDLANATVATGEATLASTIAGVRNDVRRAYFALAAADARVVLAGDVRALSARARDAAATRYAAGDVPRLEDVQATVELANAENALTAARGEQNGAAAELNALLGQPADTPIAVSDALTSGTLPALSDAVAAAAHANVDLALLDRQIAEEAARRDLAKTLETPDVTAGGAVTWDASPDFNTGWRSSLVVTVPLFTRHRAGVLVEDATLTQLHAQRDARAVQITAAVTAAIARASAAQDQLAHYQNDILPALSELDDMAQESYRQGQTNLVSLLAALQSTRDSRQQGLDAGLAYQQALADLEQAMGTTTK